MIAVTNTGTLPLTDVIVADNEAPGCVRTIGVLEPGESSTYSCGRTNIQADFTNQVMATAEPPTGPSVFDTDIAIVTVIHPSIQINKSPDTQQLFMSDTATFNITVTNNGDVPLTGVAVNDPLAPGCNRNIGDLAKGAPAVAYACTLANVKASFTNIAIVTASSAVGALQPVEDAAAVSVIVPPVNTGACVTWRYPGDTADHEQCSNGTGGLPVFLPMVVR